MLGYDMTQVENVEVMDEPANHIKFDFLGKDSIRYENQVEVDPIVWKLVKAFCGKSAKGKGKLTPQPLLLKGKSSAIIRPTPHKPARLTFFRSPSDSNSCCRP